MFIPIGDQDIKGGSFPFFSYLFIALNILVFFVLEFPLLDNSSEISSFFIQYGAQPCELLLGKDLYTILSSMFLHGGFAHLFGNMLFLWLFGDNIESIIGNFKFLLFYLLGGLIAVYSHAIFEGSIDCTPMVGASGAIAAIMGAYLIMFPRSVVKVLIIVFPVSVPAFVFLGLWGGQEIITAITNISLINEVGDGVARWAHVGGFVFGIISGFYFRYIYPKVAYSNKEYRVVHRDPKRYNNRLKK